MKTAKNNPVLIPDHLHNDVVTGKFFKTEASIFLASGKAHVHSTETAKRDADAITTIEAVNTASIPVYSWELSPAVVHELAESSNRRQLIEKIISTATPLNRDLSERLDIVLEELLTNALYHSYRNTKGEFKYRRSDEVKLSPEEAIEIRLNATAMGVFASIKDKAGTLKFDNIRESFMRCYRNAGPEIQSKERGAGLGWFMIFENITHMKVVVNTAKSTEISFWIAKKSYQRPHEFSFNFFVRSLP